MLKSPLKANSDIMTRQLLILIIYFGIWITTVFVNIPNSRFIIICSTIVFFGYQLFEFQRIAKKQIDGEVILRRKTKSVRPIFVFLAIVPTIGYFVDGRFNFLQIILFWFIVLFDIVTSILTNRFKPIAIVINGNILEMNTQRTVCRNLSKLKRLTLNGFTDEIQMTFVDENKLLIKRGEFDRLDIDRLIEICVERSKELLFISDNLKNEK